MPRPANPEVRRKILCEAEHLIHLHGFYSTSLEEIAQSCRMTKANLLHHYGSKEELGLAVLEAKIEDYRLRRISDLCSQGDPLKAVEQLFEESGRFYNGNGCKAGCFIGNMALEMSDINEKFRKRVSRFFEEWTDGIAACLERGRKNNFFNNTLDCRGAAEAIVSLYEGAAMTARTRRDSSIFLRVGKMARSLLEQFANRR